MKRTFTVLACLLIPACTTTSNAPEDPSFFARVDCQKVGGNARLETAYEQAKAICLHRAEAAAIAGTTAMPVGYGIAGSISSGIQRGMAQQEIGVATAKSCMAEQGYFYMRRSQHEARCRKKM